LELQGGCGGNGDGRIAGGARLSIFAPRRVSSANGGVIALAIGFGDVRQRLTKVKPTTPPAAEKPSSRVGDD
jgi:hypothetical protein